jgi:hypothetical protein
MRDFSSAMVEDHAGIAWDLAISVQVGKNIGLVRFQDLDMSDVVVAETQIRARRIGKIESRVVCQPTEDGCKLLGLKSTKGIRLWSLDEDIFRRRTCVSGEEGLKGLAAGAAERFGGGKGDANPANKGEP